MRHIDTRRNWVETVAIGPLPGDRTLGDARNECQPGQMEAILSWCRAGKVVQGHGGLSGTLPAGILPGPIRADVLAGPLELHDDRFGVLLLIAQPPAVFQAEHAELVQVLLEPFAAAMENDRHVAEMAALREAAEADKRSLLKRLGREKLGGDTIVGIGSGLRAVMERVALVSKSDVPVLIFGETGSGKEVVARAIHNGSPRAERPFIRVNCGAIPHELIDSQLFGHEKGAFTGATETRQGWFERADGGTLLLDELAELPPAAQVRLLRILQDGWLDRVGGQRPINVDVRIVAATHRDLPGMVAAGQFREDLWYRLAVFPIVIPPLRERCEDIPELARHFARRAATRFGLYPAEPTLADIELLMAYSWPGNVRELATVIDRAAILGDGKQLEVAKSLGVPTSPAAAAVPDVVETPLRAASVGQRDRAAGRRDSPAHRVGAFRHRRPDRRSPRRGDVIEDQPAHAARADAETENRLEGVQGVTYTSITFNQPTLVQGSRAHRPPPCLCRAASLRGTWHFPSLPREGPVDC